MTIKEDVVIRYLGKMACHEIIAIKKILVLIYLSDVIPTIQVQQYLCNQTLFLQENSIQRKKCSVDIFV